MAGGRATNEPSNYFALAKQSDKDVDGDTFIFFRHLEGTGLELDQQVESVREGGSGQEVGFHHKTAISMDGDLVAYERPVAGAALAAWTLGAHSEAAGTGAASAVTQISTAVPTSSQPYLTAEQYWADKIERVGNVRSSGWSLEGEAGRPLKLTVNLVSGGTPWSPPVASAQTPTRESSQPFFYPGGTYELTGASGAKLTKFKLDVKRGLDTDIRTTQLYREDVIGLAFDTSLEGTLKYEDKALYDKVNMSAADSKFLDPNALGLATGSFRAYTEFGAGTGLRFFEAGQPVVTFTGAKVNKLDPDGKTMYIDFSGMGVGNATHQIFVRHTVPTGALASI
jgi:hypothetical protein